MKYQLVFVKERKIFSHIIQWFTWGKASHVAIVVDGHLYESAPMHGVRSMEAEEWFKKNKSPYAIFEVEGPQEVRDFLAQQIDKPYDYLGILGFAGRADIQDKKKWFCSEYIAAAFKKAKKPLLLGSPSKISPNTLQMSPLLTLIADYGYEKEVMSLIPETLQLPTPATAKV